MLIDLEINVLSRVGRRNYDSNPGRRETTLHIPPGTQSNKVIRLSNMGMPRLQRNGRGDLLVVVQVAIPQKLTEAQRRLFQELAPTLGQKRLSRSRKKADFSRS